MKRIQSLSEEKLNEIAALIGESFYEYPCGSGEKSPECAYCEVVQSFVLNFVDSDKNIHTYI